MCVTVCYLVTVFIIMCVTLLLCLSSCVLPVTVLPCYCVYCCVYHHVCDLLVVFVIVCYFVVVCCCVCYLVDFIVIEMGIITIAIGGSSCDLSFNIEHTPALPECGAREACEVLDVWLLIDRCVKMKSKLLLQVF